MRYLSFKILVLCILLPPVLYVVSLNLLESYLQKRYATEIENIYTGDTRALLDGSVRLEDAVNRNIDGFLKSRLLVPLGVKISVMVISGAGRIVYPASFVRASALPPSDPARVAAENYTLMDAGLKVRTEVKIGYNTVISGVLLIFYIFTAVLLLFVHYKNAVGRIYRVELEKRKEMDLLREREKEKAVRLQTLTKERRQLKIEFDCLQEMLTAEKSRAATNENEMIDEIVALEEQLAQNLDRQNARQGQIQELEEKVKQYEKSRHKGGRQKVKTAEALKKRFGTLYKNLSVHERAISGFVELNEELKIKAEEVIHQLNEDPSKVTIKRKVFSRKGHQTVLEVIFAYRGRLYFRRAADNRIEVLAIGTKNTQARELEFLSRL